MPSKLFKSGDRVIWWKQTPGGGKVAPVLATVLAVTAKRVKIEAEDEEGKVVRHVLPGASSGTHPTRVVDRVVPLGDVAAAAPLAVVADKVTGGRSPQP